MDDPATATPGLDAGRLTPWLLANVSGLAAPLRYTFIPGGRSNLTYRIDDDAGRSVVLRRPPLGSVLRTAHDMSREWRVISAMSATAVPVPAPLAFGDESVIGAHFYVMEHVPGHIIAEPPDATVLPVAARHTCGHELVRVLTLLHELEPCNIGLADFGRHGDYIARQLHRWHKQVNISRTRPIPAIDELHRLLASAIPAQQRTSVVHGDYRLGNVIVDGGGRVRAVLDWELSTLGDPLADVGWLLSWWEQLEDECAGTTAATVAGGFPARQDMLRVYGDLSGLDTTDIEYYVAFARWRGACIGEGVYARYRSGVMGDDSFGVEEYGAKVAERAEYALESFRSYHGGG
jgi:aminoglycoside phosphotransferase (APT) family kinase protein